MIVFTCKCNYIWILSLEAARAVGPIFNTGPDMDADPPVWIGNKRQEIPFEQLRDNYGDCWTEIHRRISNAK